MSAYVKSKEWLQLRMRMRKNNWYGLGMCKCNKENYMHQFGGLLGNS